MRCSALPYWPLGSAGCRTEPSPADESRPVNLQPAQQLLQAGAFQLDGHGSCAYIYLFIAQVALARWPTAWKTAGSHCCENRTIRQVSAVGACLHLIAADQVEEADGGQGAFNTTLQSINKPRQTLAE